LKGIPLGFRGGGINVRVTPTKNSHVIILRVKRLTKDFSNSLIMHKEKTKEITTVTVVWIPDLN